MLAAALLLLAAVPAAATIHGTTPDAVDQLQGSSVATVVVSNFNTLDVEIYAVTEEGRKFPLGVVNRVSTRNLALPDQLADGSTEFRLKIYSVRPSTVHSAYRKYIKGVKTAALAVGQGSTISLMVGDPLTDSFINYVH
jgi:hypothetical protein